MKNQLIVATSQTQRPSNRFTYYEAAAVGVTLNGSRTRFMSGGLSNVVIVRSSIAPMPGSRLASDGTAFVFTPGGSTPPPVIWCCVQGKEVVLESDGKPDAPIAMGAGFDAGRVRALLRVTDGQASIRSWSPRLLQGPDDFDPTGSTGAFAGSPRGGTAAVGTRIAAWSDTPASGVLSVGVPSDAGVDAVVPVSLGAPILDVKADDGVAVVTVGAGRAYRVLRVNPEGAVSVAWSGATRPVTGTGRGLVAVSADRRVFASRTGAVRRVVSRSGGPVVAVAADADRVAWMERVRCRVVTKKGKRTVTTWKRCTRARLARVAS